MAKPRIRKDRIIAATQHSGSLAISVTYNRTLDDPVAALAVEQMDRPGRQRNPDRLPDAAVEFLVGFHRHHLATAAAGDEGVVADQLGGIDVARDLAVGRRRDAAVLRTDAGDRLRARC